MIESGRYIEKISEKFAILKNELIQNGQLRILNGHKYCENFVKDILNIVYNLELENLNQKGTDFKGLDIGSRAQGIAIEVSADNTSDKINSKLALIVKEKHYEIFPDIRFFFLTGKQKSYTITTATEPYFLFNWKENVLDFDDILNDIPHIGLKRLKEIDTFLSEELPLGREKIATKKKSFFYELFNKRNKENENDKDDNIVYDMSKNLWDSIRPPDSKYVHRTKKISGIPAGIQIFSFQYGTTGHALPLNLNGTYVQAEVGFSCKINNPMKAMYAGNEYAMNYLPPRFLIESRGILETYQPNQLRELRREIAVHIQEALTQIFDDAGFALLSVTIGAVDELVEASESKNDEKFIADRAPEPKLLFFNYELISEQTYNLIVGIPNNRKNDTYLWAFPLGLGNGSKIDTENITVIFKYVEKSPLPLSDKIVRLVDKSYVMPINRVFYQGEGKLCSSYTVPFLRKGTVIMIGELCYMVETKMNLEIPCTSADGVDFTAKIVAETHFFFEIIAMFKNCPTQYLKINIQFVQAKSFDTLLEDTLAKFANSKDDKTEHILYYPDFKKAYRRDGKSLIIGHLNGDNFRIISKPKGENVRMVIINQNKDAIEL